MRRLALIFLTLWTCALVPAMPSAVAVSEKAATCACCCSENGCDNRNCVPPPAPVRAGDLVIDATSSVRVAPARVAPRPDDFSAFGCFTTLTLRPVLPHAVLDRVAPASVPVFAEHCCRLL
jgi:hypothetical protein